MKPKKTKQSPQKDLFREERHNLININHELCQLATIIESENMISCGQVLIQRVWPHWLHRHHNQGFHPA